jgi:hypothetical protein
VFVSDAHMAMILNCTEPGAVGLKRIEFELVTPTMSTHVETIDAHRRPGRRAVGTSRAFNPDLRNAAELTANHEWWGLWAQAWSAASTVKPQA